MGGVLRPPPLSKTPHGRGLKTTLSVDMWIRVREGAAFGRPLPYAYNNVDSLMRQISGAAQAAFGASLCLTGAGRLLYAEGAHP